MSTTHAIESSRFRQVLGHVPTGVAVVTAIDEDEPVGLAVGSFCSVSLDPPLVVFFATKTSSTLPRIERAGAFCANVLAADQEDVCRTFAAKDEDRFARHGWAPGTSGAPVLERALAYVDCTIERVDDAGDHRAVYGRVVDLGTGDEQGPLVFFRGGYGGFSV